MKVHLIYKHGIGQNFPAVMACATKEAADRELDRLEEQERKSILSSALLSTFLKSEEKDKWYYSVEMDVVE
jgi:hypothetical protein